MERISQLFEGSRLFAYVADSTGFSRINVKQSQISCALFFGRWKAVINTDWACHSFGYLESRIPELCLPSIIGV